MQYNNTPLFFLREKIQDMRIALFKSDINSEISLPNNIIETISTDENGNVYFFTSCKGNYASQIDTAFYAYLDYHKKGNGMRLRISGKAEIIKEEADLAAPEIEDLCISGRSVVLVKMKIMQAEYVGDTIPGVTRMQKIRSSFNHLFLPPSAQAEQHYNFG